MDTTGDLSLWNLTPERLRGVRKKDGLISIYDVLGLITNQPPKACSKVWARLLESHPEWTANCRPFKFISAGRACHVLTPATNAQGIVQILMAAPGNAAIRFRIKAADTLVRFLGGDPTLVPEIEANRRAQERLATQDPDHPARVFGEAVESVQSVSTSHIADLLDAQRVRAEMESRLLRLYCAADSYDLARNPRMREREGPYLDSLRAAMRAASLPPWRSPYRSVSAREYLLIQGHTIQEADSLLETFENSMWDAMVAVGMEGPHTERFRPPTGTRVYQYNTQKERDLLDLSYGLCALTPEFRALMPPGALQQRFRQLAIATTRA